MPFRIIRNDITKMEVDAIVNTANPKPAIGEGTDSRIYQAAGAAKLLAARMKIGDISRGEAAVTPAFGLQAKYIIHTVGPRWRNGMDGERIVLRSCYENCLKLAAKKKCESIAFPFISTGNYGFPKDQALEIVLSVVEKFLEDHEMMIYLVVYDRESVLVSESKYGAIRSYLRGEPERTSMRFTRSLDRRREQFFEEDSSLFLSDFGENSISGEFSERPIPGDFSEASLPDDFSEAPILRNSCERPSYNRVYPGAPQEKSRKMSVSIPMPKKRTLQDILKRKDETFQEMLLRLIKEKGMKNADVYKKANQDKKLFSKIKNDKNYQPKKKTVMAFALALELNLDETKDLLARAGYAFSPSNDFDLAMQYFIENQNYNIYEIEIVLDDLGLGTLCNY